MCDPSQGNNRMSCGRACQRTGWRVYGWVLMGNHYHLLVKTPRANLVSGMPSRLALILEEKLNSKALDYARLI